MLSDEGVIYWVAVHFFPVWQTLGWSPFHNTRFLTEKSRMKPMGRICSSQDLIKGEGQLVFREEPTPSQFKINRLSNNVDDS